MELKIGSKIKKLRTDKGMSIADLSKASEVSTGLISQIERDMVVPSVVNLYKIAGALNTNISFFFDDEENSCRVIKNGSHKIMFTNDGANTYQLISPDRGDHVMDFVKISIKPGHEETPKKISHHGEECGYVISGTLTVLLGDEKIILEEGDSIYFKSTVPHVYMNEGDVDAVSIWTMTPRFF